MLIKKGRNRLVLIGVRWDRANKANGNSSIMKMSNTMN